MEDYVIFFESAHQVIDPFHLGNRNQRKRIQNKSKLFFKRTQASRQSQLLRVHRKKTLRDQ